MKRFAALMLTLVTVFTFLVVSSVVPEKKAMAYPAAGNASDCSPDGIWSSYSLYPSGFHSPQVYGPFDGWSYSYGVSGSWTFSCPPPSVSYAYSCIPCYSIRLYRNTGYPSNPPAWVDMQKPESYFQVTNSPTGLCGSGGTFNTGFMMTGLTAGQYEIQITFGAGDDRRCYTLGTFAHTFVVP